MNRQVIDGMIIAAVLALGATHLFAQSAAGRRVIRPDQGGVNAAHRVAMVQPETAPRPGNVACGDDMARAPGGARVERNGTWQHGNGTASAGPVPTCPR